MNKQKYIRSKRGKSLMLAVIVISCVYGCSSIPSKAVKELVLKENKRINQAKRNAKDLIASTDKAIKAWEESVIELNGSLQEQKKIESVHALIFSSNQNIATKTGVDAHAAGYLIGELYLAERMGLEQVVQDQFKEDFKTLKEVADQIKKSWAALGMTQKVIDDFAAKSSVASLDPELMGALLVEFGGDSDMIDKALKHSSQVNKVLKKASGIGLLKGLDSGRAQSVIGDVVNLLERVKDKEKDIEK